MKCRAFAAAIMMTSVLFLGGCGGGDGGSSSAPLVKGFWIGTTANGTTKAIVLANGDAWFVFGDTSNTITSFDRLQLVPVGNSYTASGKQYLLQSGTTATATATGSFIEKTSFTGTIGSSALGNLVYDTHYDAVASQSDVGGSWSGAFGAGSSTLTLTIDGTTGVVSGSNTNACTYSGSANPRTADPALFDVSLTETCLVGTPAHLSGIATVNAAKSVISVAVTTADKASGALFVGQKQ